jgi:hypothetical protein
MAKLLLIIGPQAVGKMTVGQKLEKITNLKFMHNHETLELPARIFGWGSESRRKLTSLFRWAILEEVAKSDLEGLIFTLVFSFDHDSDWGFFEKVKTLFEENNGEVIVVELEADLEERLKRNKTENRLNNKPSKRNLEFTEKEIVEDMQKYRLNSFDGEFDGEKYIKINNTNLSAEEVAKMVKEKFDL